MPTIVYGQFTIQEVFDMMDAKKYPRVKAYRKGKGAGNYQIDFMGHKINVLTRPLRTFKNNGIKCVSCGIEGKYFQLENNGSNGPSSPYFMLYALSKKKQAPIRMTCDHIIARSLGGPKQRLSNLQPMCAPCNKRKGIIENHILNITRTLDQINETSNECI